MSQPTEMERLLQELKELESAGDNVWPFVVRNELFRELVKALTKAASMKATLEEISSIAHNGACSEGDALIAIRKLTIDYWKHPTKGETWTPHSK